MYSMIVVCCISQGSIRDRCPGDINLIASAITAKLFQYPANTDQGRGLFQTCRRPITAPWPFSHTFLNQDSLEAALKYVANPVMGAIESLGNTPLICRISAVRPTQCE